MPIMASTMARGHDGPMAMVPILTPTEATEPMDTDTPMPIMASTMARGLLRLSPPLLPSPMLMPTTMVPTDWDTDWVTMVWDTEPTDTPMPIMPTTTARGPLSPPLSPPLLPSPRLIPTMATTVMAPGPTMGTDWGTEDTDWATEATSGDKFSASEVQSRSSKRTSLLVI